MKKLIIIAAMFVSGAVTLTHAQGTIFANNSNGTKISTNSVVGGAATGLTSGTIGGFYYALFASASSTTINGSTAAYAGYSGSGDTHYAFNDAGWTLQLNGGTANGVTPGAFMTNTATAGRYAITSPNTDGAFTSQTIAGGSAGYFAVIGWSSNLGSTLAQAIATLNAGTVAGFIGQSAVSGQLTLGTLGSTSPTALYGASSPNIQGFTLGLVTSTPEPGTMALAALGGASLLLFRRRK